MCIYVDTHDISQDDFIYDVDILYRWIFLIFILLEATKPMVNGIACHNWQSVIDDRNYVAVRGFSARAVISNR
jgi:hypothetical protein